MAISIADSGWSQSQASGESFVCAASCALALSVAPNFINEGDINATEVSAAMHSGVGEELDTKGGFQKFGEIESGALLEKSMETLAHSLPANPPSTNIQAAAETLLQTSVSVAFERYFVSRGKGREEALIHLLEAASPSRIIQAALDGFQKFGNSDRLDEAVIILGKVKKRSVPALAKISRTPEAGQSSFVELVAHADFLTREEQDIMLCDFARSSEIETREKVLDVVDFVDTATSHKILKILVHDTDDDIAERAAAMQQEQCSSCDFVG